MKTNWVATDERFVEMESRGLKMRGMVHYPTDFSAAKPAPCVMLWHGFGGTRVEPHRVLVKTARALARKGIVACRFDFTGNGDSEGDFETVTPETEIGDALKLIEWLQTQDGIDKSRLGLIGLSLGGFVSACTAARAQETKIKALCLWAATRHIGTRLNEGLSQSQRDSLHRNGYFDAGGNRVGLEFLEAALRLDPAHELQRFHGAALVIHGTNDTVVPLSEARDYERALAHCRPQTLWMDGADHTFNSVEWEKLLMKTTVNFLVEQL